MNLRTALCAPSQPAMEAAVTVRLPPSGSFSVTVT